MAGVSYDEVRRTVESLTPSEQLRLVAELAERLSKRVDAPKGRSLLELRGLGKEVWTGLDPDEYIRQERSSWDG
jgi:hypothetical protein